MIDEHGYRTARLRVQGWHLAERSGAIDDLPATVAAMLTAPVTRWLPPHWQGPWSRARAAAWIAEQDAEGRVLLVASRATHAPLGLVLLHEEAAATGVDVRLGYLLAEHAWGRGYGGELLEGFVAWCRAAGTVQAIIGGVAPQNSASIRLLERHGFVPEAHTGDEDGEAERLYRLDLERERSARGSGTGGSG